MVDNTVPLLYYSGTVNKQEQVMIVALGLICGNFFYQWAFKSTPDWIGALSTSVYQAEAIFIYWLFNKG